MTSAKATSVLLVALLLASSFGTVSAGSGGTGVGDADRSAAGDAENAAGNTGTQTFHVVQGDECYEVTAVGSGEKTVSEFYDYRSGPGTLYGSYGDGSQSIQENQVSHVFVYDGADGLSLVMLHDDLNESDGGAASFHVSGLPEDREWVVEDDDYPDRDDNFVHGETESTVHWMWSDGRTDGAAVRGLDGEFEAVTIDAEWGEDSWAYRNRTNPWPFATDDIDDWQLQSGDGTEFSLDKSEPITVERGGCSESGGDDSDGDDSDSDDSESGDDSEDEKSDATLSVSSANVTADESVTFEANGVAEACENVTYEWGFDADGDVDEKTDDSTASHSYDGEGSYDATVTVVHEDGSEDTSSETIEVESGEQQSACDPEEEETASE
ncbi:PKD domain-containing protein [Halorussus salinisoli]|uniref:PKD domain-containing protein n=1 Tax=Halorussus salinisoli TaxID=2558242 RepID=UPI0010C16161|nr:PKD domain-containing protein [Halorussus salinisoli]